jgi:hypothetical protein
MEIFSRFKNQISAFFGYSLRKNVVAHLPWRAVPGTQVNKWQGGERRELNSI